MKLKVVLKFPPRRTWPNIAHHRQLTHLHNTSLIIRFPTVCEYRLGVALSRGIVLDFAEISHSTHVTPSMVWTTVLAWYRLGHMICST
jgi:hypothetical protein